MISEIKIVYAEYGNVSPLFTIINSIKGAPYYTMIFFSLRKERQREILVL